MTRFDSLMKSVKCVPLRTSYNQWFVISHNSNEESLFFLLFFFLLIIANEEKKRLVNIASSRIKSNV